MEIVGIGAWNLEIEANGKIRDGLISSLCPSRQFLIEKNSDILPDRRLDRVREGKRARE